MRRLCGFVLLCVLVSMACAQGRPYTVDDMLRTEELGNARFDESGTRLFFERYSRYDRQADYGRAALGGTRAKIQAIDASRSQPAAPLFEQQETSGYVMGQQSPGGRLLAYLRSDSRGTVAGTVDLSSGARADLPFSVEFDFLHTPWVNARTLIVNALPASRPSPDFTRLIEPQEQTARRWQEQRQGQQPTAHVMGSGRYAPTVRQQYRLLSVDAISGVATELAEGKFSIRAMSHDGRFLAALRDDVADMDPDAPVRTSNTVLGVQRSLHVFDLGTGKHVEACAQCDVLAYSLSWSPGSRYLAFVARDANKPWSDATHRIYDRQSGRTTAAAADGIKPRIDDNNGLLLAVRAAWLGERLAILAAKGADSRADWYLLDQGKAKNLTASFAGSSPDVIGMTERALVIAHDGQIWSVDATGRTVHLSRGIDAPLRAWRDDEIVPGAAPPRNDVAFGRTVVVQDDGDGKQRPRTIYFIDVATGSIQSVSARSVNATVAAVSAASHRVAFSEQSGAASRLVVSDALGVPTREVAEVNAYLNDVDAGTPVRLAYRNKSGDQRASWLLLPPGYRAGDKLPMVVIVYPGHVSPTSFDRWRLDSVDFQSPYLLAAAGYAVLRPSVVFDSSRNAREPIAEMLDDVMASVDAAIDAGYVDKDRIGLQGHSYGGYATAAILTLTDRFKAGVAFSGLYDLISSYGIFDPKRRLNEDYSGAVERAQWSEAGQGGMGSPPWDDPQRYLRNSPIMRVRSLHTPLMLIHGDIDFVSVTQAEELFTALTRVKKDAVFVQYGGEEHALESPANIRDLWARLLKWYGEHLANAAENSHADPIHAGPT